MSLKHASSRGRLSRLKLGAMKLIFRVRSAGAGPSRTIICTPPATSECGCDSNVPQ